jgi:hypothetical protein
MSFNTEIPGIAFAWLEKLSHRSQVSCSNMPVAHHFLVNAEASAHPKYLSLVNLYLYECQYEHLLRIVNERSLPTQECPIYTAPVRERTSERPSLGV